jgi:hypothetical protein
MRMELIAIVEDAWDWTGLRPEQIVGDKDFGNPMIKDQSVRYWRRCPEDQYCKIIANSAECTKWSFKPTASRIGLIQASGAR